MRLGQLANHVGDKTNQNLDLLLIPYTKISENENKDLKVKARRINEKEILKNYFIISKEICFFK